MPRSKEGWHVSRMILSLPRRWAQSNNRATSKIGLFPSKSSCSSGNASEGRPASRQDGVVIQLGGKLLGLLDLGSYFFRLEGLPVFLELALPHILRRLAQRVK